MINSISHEITNLLTTESIATIYYSGLGLISSILIGMVVENWLEFKRMRVVMGFGQLNLTLITILSFGLEPLCNTLGWGLWFNPLNCLITPTSIIGLIGLLSCGIANARINHRIWRTEFPTRPYPQSLKG